jgi:hypothetical protein
LPTLKTYHIVHSNSLMDNWLGAQRQLALHAQQYGQGQGAGAASCDTAVCTAVSATGYVWHADLNSVSHLWHQ